MLTTKTAIIYVSALHFFSLICTGEEELLVNTTSGLVQGIQLRTFNGKIVSAYFGIPYAAPPIGNQRFKPPIPAVRSTLTIDGTKKGNSCMQKLPAADNPLLPKKKDTSEDCLFLNIWVPSPRPENATVMVFIHGGGFMSGSSSLMAYDGRILSSENNVIIVSINYRLDVFGFLSLNNEAIPGNVGLMDQALALRWIQSNIGYFGGNNKVTIFGASAGAGSVGLHYVIPSSWDLFQRGILESGTSTSKWCTSGKKRAAEKAKIFVKLAGCSSMKADDIVDCLQQKDSMDLIIASSKVPSGTGWITPFGPVVDGEYLPDDPKTLLKTGKVKKETQILLGLAKQDGLFLPLSFGVLNYTGDSNVSSEVFKKCIKWTINNNHDALAEATKFIYTDWSLPNTTNWKLPLVDFMTDWFFTCSANSFGDLQSRIGNSVFRYRVDHKPSINKYMPAWTGANHCDEIGFVFGWPLDSALHYTKEEAAFSKTIMNYWAQFSKNGDPNINGEKAWPLYSEFDKNILILDLEVATRKGSQLYQCAFLENMLPKIV